MTATKLNFPIEQADFLLAFPIPSTPGSPGSLVGACAALQIRRFIGDTEAIVTLTTENGGLSINAGARTITAILDAATTACIPAGPYVYDLKLLDATGKTYRVFQGIVTVSGEVTLVVILFPSPSPAPAPAPSPDAYGNSSGDNYGNSNGDEYGPLPAPSPSPGTTALPGTTRSRIPAATNTGRHNETQTIRSRKMNHKANKFSHILLLTAALISGLFAHESDAAVISQHRRRRRDG